LQRPYRKSSRAKALQTIKTPEEEKLMARFYEFLQVAAWRPPDWAKEEKQF
jgi:hypothetical protein